ncbi:lanthionine synthetase LanC family protein [Proteiniphilum acetatigenes]|uniref:lanthionine synthetase LanC family protein n=1 Tax=Proteiniphilum acetatigenes TaxID=294710 RepID=UPI00039EB8ED|nr:lanthionine synthetase LanC family protein [Proteiniphilum acetatigenes]
MIDYLLLNAYSVNSSGLYNGKAGISLCFFEIARFLQDEYIEEQAFELLQESLLTKNEDIGFENGLSGIGYVLLYLIKNQFIEADFEELFGNQQRKIEEYIENLKVRERDKDKFVRYNLKVIFFLDSLFSHNVKYRRVESLFPIFSDTACRLLEEYASTIDKKQKVCLKTEYVAFFEMYLKAAAVCQNFQCSSDMLDTYIRIFTQDQLVSNFIIGYYLENTATDKNHIWLKGVAEINRIFALKNLYPATMSLAQRIELLYLLRQDEDLYKEQIKLLEKDLFDSIPQSALERNLLSATGTDCFVAGYQSGIARFLLYWIYRNADKVKRKHIPFL